MRNAKQDHLDGSQADADLASAVPVGVEIWQAARTHAFDQYLCALLSPSNVREDLIVWAAFVGEAARVPFLVSEPTLGDIRLQWWRDWLAGLSAMDETGVVKTGNPLADALCQVIRRHDLPKERLLSLLDARGEEAYVSVVATPQALQSHLKNTTGVSFEVTARIINLSTRPEYEEVLTNAIEAVGSVDVLRRLPWYVARGRWPLPIVGDVIPPAEDIFSQDSAAVRSASLNAAYSRIDAAMARIRSVDRQVLRELRLVLLELALVEPYLRVLKSQAHDPMQMVAEISPLKRVWRLWQAKLRRGF